MTPSIHLTLHVGKPSLEVAIQFCAHQCGLGVRQEKLQKYGL